MTKVKQLTISLENQPGALAQVAQVLADAKVNIVALMNSTAGAQGSAQVVVDNVNKAKKALGGAGLSYTEGTLEQFELNNKPGALADVTGKLAKKASTSIAPTPLCTRARRRRSWCLRSPDLPYKKATEWRLVAGQASDSRAGES